MLISPFEKILCTSILLIEFKGLVNINVWVGSRVICNLIPDPGCALDIKRLTHLPLLCFYGTRFWGEYELPFYNKRLALLIMHTYKNPTRINNTCFKCHGLTVSSCVLVPLCLPYHNARVWGLTRPGNRLCTHAVLPSFPCTQDRGHLCAHHDDASRVGASTSGIGVL